MCTKHDKPKMALLKTPRVKDTAPCKKKVLSFIKERLPRGKEPNTLSAGRRCIKVCMYKFVQAILKLGTFTHFKFEKGSIQNRRSLLKQITKDQILNRIRYKRI